MSDNLTVRITADISSLKEQFDAAKAAISDLAQAFNELGKQSGTDPIQQRASKAADTARRLTDEIAQADEQLELKRIAAIEHVNNFDLAMGNETLDKWKQIADQEASAKYEAEINYLQKKAAADKGNALQEQKDRDQMRAALQDYLNASATIKQQYLEKDRQLNRADLQDYVKAQQDKLQAAISGLDVELRTHEITLQQKHDLEAGYIASYRVLIDEAYDAALQGMKDESDAYKQLKKQELEADRQFTRQIRQNDVQLIDEQSQKWTQLGNSIRSSFNSAVDSMLFQGKSFGQGMLMIAQGVIKAFLEMGEKIAEDWIETQITALFTTKTTQSASAMSQVTAEAGVAAATAYAQWAAFPPLAEAMAAEAFANTMAWGSAAGLAVGAWEIPQDMHAIIHQGEMVVPRTFAQGLRSGQGFGGGDVNMHYAPTINAHEPASLSQMLTRESGEMLAWLNRQFRNGALRTA